MDKRDHTQAGIRPGAIGKSCHEDRVHPWRSRLSGEPYDNPSARDFASMLPLELTIEDYANNEKIAYLPRKLTEDGSGPFANEAPGDLCYYVPWGNLAFFYAGYRYSRGLIRLGRLDNGFEPLLNRQVSAPNHTFKYLIRDHGAKVKWSFIISDL